MSDGTDHTATFRAVTRLSPEQLKTLDAFRKRKRGSFTVDAVLKYPDYPANFKEVVAWFPEQSADVQEDYIARHLPDPKPPRAAPVRTKPPHGARLKEAIRQAKRETPKARQAVIAESADRLLAQWGVNFKDECPDGWRREKSLVAALNDPLLKAAVKTYISKV
jgi:hypothetical protein